MGSRASGRNLCISVERSPRPGPGEAGREDGTSTVVCQTGIGVSCWRSVADLVTKTWNPSALLQNIGIIDLFIMLSEGLFNSFYSFYNKIKTIEICSIFNYNLKILWY